MILKILRRLPPLIEIYFKSVKIMKRLKDTPNKIIKHKVNLNKSIN